MMKLDRMDIYERSSEQCKSGKFQLGHNEYLTKMDMCENLIGPRNLSDKNVNQEKVKLLHIEGCNKDSHPFTA